MPVGISYMGTKQALAPAVAKIIEQAQPGILLDAFSGMCSVGEQVAPERQIWSNDVQLFSAEVARALFTSRDEPPRPHFIVDKIYDAFEKHQIKLVSAFPCSLEAERKLLESKSFSNFQKLHKSLCHTLSKEISTSPPKKNNLFTRSYSNNYFGLQQAIDIDAICTSIFKAQKERSITEDQRRWFLVALGRVILKVSNTTGHFAQFLKPKSSSYKKYLAQRGRDVWSTWVFSTGELQPAGNADWRKNNRTFNEDSLGLISKFRRRKQRPSVVYADPPYTDDQYSRFYHLLDTLLLYDYPELTGAGLYRPNRFTTPFSLKSKVSQTFESFVKDVSKIGADLVLSYPTNGLLHETNNDPMTILRSHFKKVEKAYSMSHDHSTFGASKGLAKSRVIEVIYMAKL